MARNTQFLPLVEMLRREVGKSDSAALGAADLPSLKQVLNRTYETLCDDHDWPHLISVLPKKPMVAGERYYDLPNEVPYENIVHVSAWWSNIERTLERGITLSDYNGFDSTIGIRSDPPLKWDIRFTDTHEQMEIWPIPASNSASVQVTAKAAFAPLLNDDDTCRLDDQLVVLFAAAELLADDRPKMAAAKQALAKSRYARLKGRGMAASPITQFGLGGDHGSIHKRLQVTVRAR